MQNHGIAPVSSPQRLLALTFVIAILAFCFSAAAQLATRTSGVAYDLPSFFQVVQPMKHPLGQRMPLLLWNLPMPVGQQLIWSRQSGSLRKVIDDLGQRGIAPTIQLPGGSGGLALARTLQEAHQPIYLLNNNPALIEGTAWRDCRVWVAGPDATRSGLPRNWPCLPLANPEPGAKWVRQQIAPFKEANLQVDGVLYDDEGLPYSVNGIYEASVKSPEIRQHYPPGTFDSRQAFDRYTLRLHETLERKIMVDPVHELFPHALVGEFADCSSSEQTPFVDGYGLSSPPRHCEGDLAMPVLYANNILLDGVLQSGKPLTQQRADDVYLFVLLRTLSTGAINARQEHKKLVPYVGQVVLQNPSSKLRWAMSRRMWRELQYHIWLRGADGMVLFNLGYPNSGISADFSFHSVEDARQVYDDLLTYREFLEKGEPMNETSYPLASNEPIWSGLRLPDRCLVRAFTPGEKAGSVKVSAYENINVTLEAPPMGALYLIGKDGSVRKVE